MNDSCSHSKAEYITSDWSGITPDLILEMYYCPDCGRYILRHVHSGETLNKDDHILDSSE